MNDRNPQGPPRYREIYNRIRTSIAEGRLRAGDRLPSSRALAAELNVARGTVDTAYELLSGEGFVVSRGRRGMIVSPTMPATPIAPPPSPSALGMGADRKAHTPVFAPPRPLATSLPSFDLFPRTLWSQIVGRHVRRAGVGGFSYPDPMGAAGLREALVAYLAVARDVRCAPEQIVITGGYQSALGLICQTIVKPGVRVWLETPGYPLTRSAVSQVGGEPVLVRVDDEGLDVDHGLALAPTAELCVVAPSNQFPMGVSLSLRRRLALLEWANKTGSWIVEDDYAGEFRYGGWPLPALKSLDHNERVFYIGTFSKTMFPGLRLGYLIVPNAHLPNFRNAVRRLDGGRPALEQSAVAEFLTEGHFGRHIKRMRSAYQSRRAALASAMSETFGDRFPIHPTVGGLNLLAMVRPDEDDADLVARAEAGGLQPSALTRFGAGALKPKGLLLGFANLPEAQAGAIVQRLEEALRKP